jgi:hypothetical protein
MIVEHPQKKSYDTSSTFVLLFYTDKIVSGMNWQRLNVCRYLRFSYATAYSFFIYGYVVVCFANLMVNPA